MSPAAEAMGSSGNDNYELLYSLRTDGDIPLTKYRSKRTGLTLCFAHVEGPVVSGHLCVVTETHSDDGLPHTLEHLIFLGSEDYPYKGILDLVANRCLASGTNAWTDTDHTNYTVTTAGSEGFLNLLPMYLDHVLYPLLSESAFITEVHHINAEGEDAGVVYCEMQGMENTGERLCHHAMLRALYPGVCGYKSETGGLLKNLRESTTKEKVRDFHKTCYRPENLCIIITGQINPLDVFKVLDKTERKIESKGPRMPFQRLWQSLVPELTGSVDLVIPYPCDDDENGLVYIAWRGPKVKEYETIAGLIILQEYLTDTSVSPLEKYFVECEDPYCTSVSPAFIENSETALYFSFENVSKLKLPLIKEKLLDVLKAIESTPDAFDMKRMTTVIQRRKLRILNEMESSPHETLAFNLIGDFIYGDNLQDLQSRVCQIPIIDKLSTYPSSYWQQLIRKYFLDGNIVTIIGEPSPKLLEEMTAQEKERVRRQKEELGPEGLKAKAEALLRAIEENERPPPEELLTSVPVPSLSSISFHSITRACNQNGDVGIGSFSLKDMPCRFQLDHIKTNFASMYVLMNTSTVSPELRLYLPLFVELILESPVLRNGAVIPYEEVVSQLEADTVHIQSSLGLENSTRFFCGSYAQAATLCILVEPEKYNAGIQWIQDLLFHIQFSPARIQSVATKMMNAVSEMKRKGMKVVRTILKNLYYNESSNHYTASMIRQHTFLAQLLQTLSKDSAKVVEDLSKLRSLITQPQNLILHVSVNVDKLTQLGDVHSPWKRCLPFEIPSLIQCNFPVPCHQLIQSKNRDVPSGVIAGVGSVESSFLIQTVGSLTCCTHADLPALMVLNQYLTQTEGPLWKQIRGQGLSYHYNLFTKLSEGLLTLLLARSTHLVSAYREFKTIVEKYLNNPDEWDESLFEASKSSLVFELIENEKSVSDISFQSLLAYHRGVDMGYLKNLLEMISKVTIDDLKRVGKEYLPQLFNPDLSKVAICCHPSKVEEVVKSFKDFSRELVVLPTLEDGLLAKL